MAQERESVFETVLVAMGTRDAVVDEFEGVEENEAEATDGGVVEVALAAGEFGLEGGVGGSPAVEGSAVDVEASGGEFEGEACAEEGDGGELAGGERLGKWGRGNGG
jgi:hypothetical protein